MVTVAIVDWLGVGYVELHTQEPAHIKVIPITTPHARITITLVVEPGQEHLSRARSNHQHTRTKRDKSTIQGEDHIEHSITESSRHDATGIARSSPIIIGGASDIHLIHVELNQDNNITTLRGELIRLQNT